MNLIRFKIFLRNHFVKFRFNPPWTRLGAPGAVHPLSAQATDTWATGPTCQPQQKGERTPASRSSSPVTPFSEPSTPTCSMAQANQMTPYARPRTDQSELAAGHGGTVALLTVDLRRWPGRARLERFGSFAVQRRA